MNPAKDQDQPNEPAATRLAQPAMEDPIQLLRKGAAFFDPWVDENGECLDPALGEPFQYGTAYHAYLRATLATLGEADERDRQLDLAFRGLTAALRHVADPSEPAPTTQVNPDTGDRNRANHRDFFWPAILKTYRLLKDSKVPQLDGIADKIASVDPFRSFISRPPINASMVWLNGEWRRREAGLGGLSRQAFDEHIAVFFESTVSVDGGFYQEKGHPNSYDIFTRYFLTDLLERGWEGAWAEQSRRLLHSGLRRSLGLQLSDGSLASAHRSTGQTWTDGIQIAYFALAARLLAETDPGTAARARAAADRAYASLTRFFRADGSFSPVQNRLPAAARVGYEVYTADANYSNLALSFLADALLAGYRPRPFEEAPASPCVYSENAPFFRGTIHHGPYSAHLNTFPSPGYDGLGLVDVTFGPGRMLHWSGSVHPLGKKEFFNPGMALRVGSAEAEKLRPLAGLSNSAPLDLDTGKDAAWLRAQVRPRGGFDDLTMTVAIDAEGIHITENLGKNNTPKAFLLPYLRDTGSGKTTTFTTQRADGRGFVGLLSLGGETIAVSVDEAVAEVRHLPWHFVGRRGYHGLVRVDLRSNQPTMHYHFKIVR